MLPSQPSIALPTELDLPFTDNKPVDNELQLLIPFLLRAMLGLAWQERLDWFFGINMGIYYDPKVPMVEPDAFLSLGVPRYRSHRPLRLSYVIWEEQVVPQFALEIVSQKRGGEYDEKMGKYANMGILYYIIYNPLYWRRDKHDCFEIYQLDPNTYQYIRQNQEPFWMPEIGLGIGRSHNTHDGLTQEWLYWYDEQGQPFPAPENVIAEERSLRVQLEQQMVQMEQTLSQAEQELAAAEQVVEQERQARSIAEQQAAAEREQRLLAEQQLQSLLEQLRQQGIEPENLS